MTLLRLPLNCLYVGPVSHFILILYQWGDKLKDFGKPRRTRLLVISRWHIQCKHVFVPGHSGDPRNEIADALALCAAQGHPLQDWSSLFAMLTNRTFVQALAWGWAFQHPTFRDSWSNDVPLFPTKPHTSPNPAAVGPFQVDGQVPAKDNAVVKLSILTCNVLTLMGSSDSVEHATLGPAAIHCATIPP